jgi:Methyltransferase domain
MITEDHPGGHAARLSPVTASARLRGAAMALACPPLYARPGSYLSPLTGEEDIRRALSWRDTPPGITLQEDSQEAFAAAARPVLECREPGPRYRRTDNTMFGPADAAVYRAVIDRYRPRRIIEAGSGFSTAVALDEAALIGLDMHVTCVEPYPERLESLLFPGDPVALIRRPVQDVPIAEFTALGAGDILFIDSSHVAKAGSDVTWLILRVLPLLVPGVLVHIHDVFWPYGYPPEWLRQRRDWNESYFLFAFLSGNPWWEILLWNSWLWQARPHLIPKGLASGEPGSIWLLKTA